jgi:hypothetical protein
MVVVMVSDSWANVQSEPRAWLAHFVLLGAQNVPAMLVGSTALLGSVVFIFSGLDSLYAELGPDVPYTNR